MQAGDRRTRAERSRREPHVTVRPGAARTTVESRDGTVTGVLDGFLVLAVVVAVGWGIGRSGILGPSAVEVLSRAAFFVASPALLFSTISTSDVHAVFSGALLVTAVSSTAACLLYLVFAVVRRRPVGESVIGAMCSGYVNAGNLGLPIVTYVLKDPSAIAPVLLFQLAVLGPVGATVLDAVTSRESGRRLSVLRTASAPLRNPIAIATGAGLVVAFTGWHPPEIVMAPVHLVAGIAVPGMLLAFGISLHGAARPGRGGTGVPLVVVSVLKNLGQPAIAVATGTALGMSGGALLAVAVCAALPTAQNMFAYAVRYRQGQSLARDAGLVTTVVSIPVMIGVVALLA
ncbi:AEC family transporter [Pseudonocardia benzenivorans]|uniref:Auxin Efflux Carrier n=1 Tax=Pseudonocardia dioxanivorans (strain ATCC 55486 / DSM 44775 / JCM 13855 / CB1190) TaxID=675635 RepID=F4CMF0_PSEUX|nr:Auxin Efflux Carrier [Pseudonocardia dioxanivorans CB1190]